jgi:hypothetical protein
MSRLLVKVRDVGSALMRLDGVKRRGRVASRISSGVLVALAVAASGSVAAPAAAQDDLPFLSVKQSKRYIRTALRRDFGKTYRRGHAKYIDGCTRKPRIARRPGRVRCHVGWRRGRFSYAGDAAIWLRGNADGEVRWWYAYSIAETDEQCLDDGGSEDQCVYVYDV